MLTSIDHVILPVNDLEAASAPFQKLGLNLTPPARHAHQGTENRALFVGGESEFYVELLGVHDREAAKSAGREDLLGALEAPAGLWRVMLATNDLDAARKRLEGAGVATFTREVSREGGSKICDVLIPDTHAAGCTFSIVQYGEDAPARAARHREAGLFNHGLGLKRLDHLAAIVSDLDETAAFWETALGVPVFGEVPMGPALIRQMKVGDAILELIAPTTEDSPMRARPAGLISMCAFEVANLDAAVDAVRERGFTCPGGAPGPLPGTRVASVPGAELSGMTLQLLEYV